jgi:signal transduction protein with GAF and PtsI domain
VQFNAKEYLAVALNNYAVMFDSLEAAQEALTIIQPYLEAQADNMHLCYVAAFSAWQIARLTTDADLAESAKLGLRAHLMAEWALERAIQKNDQTFISFSHVVLTQIEKDFPDIAIDLEATTGKSNSNLI